MKCLILAGNSLMRRRWLLVLLISVSIASLFIWPSKALAVSRKVLHVGKNSQFSSIQHAVNSTSSAYSYLIKVAQGVYRENVRLSQSHTIRIQGGWNHDFSVRDANLYRTVVDGDGTDSVFAVSASSGVEIHLVLDGMTIRNGRAARGGGISTVASDPGAYLKLVLLNNKILNNSTTEEMPSDGGGLWLEASRHGSVLVALLKGNLFEGNNGRCDGAIAAQSVFGARLSATLISNLIARNTASQFSAGIWLNAGLEGSVSILDLTRNRIEDNGTPELDGGGLAAYASGEGARTVVRTKNNIIQGNRAQYGGGLFFYSWGTGAALDLRLTNDLIVGNHAFTVFGGIVVTSTDNALATLTMKNCTVAENLSGDLAEGLTVFEGPPAWGTPPDLDASTVEVSLINDILTGTTVFGSFTSATRILAQASYSLIGPVNNYQASYSSRHCIDADPLFRDAPGLNFHLRRCSPAIDAGRPEEAYYDGRRPPGKGEQRADMGAYGGPDNYKWP